VLIERIKNLLKKKKRCRILALTFSNLAAEEMKNRLDEDSDIGDYLENVTVGTIHSFALDLVQQRGNLIGLNENLTLFEDNTDRQRMLRDVFYTDKELVNILRKQEHPEKFLNECLAMIAEQKKKFISPEIYEGNENFARLYKDYNDFLFEQNAIDFDDILFYAYKILTENPSVQKMYSSLYKYICVDESQDLNYAQYELIKALCGNDIKNVMFVGDANQSIYGFNGSDSGLMTYNFVNDFQPQIFELNENFRSSKRIVEYANYLENTVSTPNCYYNGELKAYKCLNEKKEAEFVVNRIIELTKYGHPDIEKIPVYEDFAIIARSRYALLNVEKLLEDKGIPFYYRKSVNGIEAESEYMKVFDLVIRVWSNKADVFHYNELLKLLKINVKDRSQISLNNVLNGTVYEPILDTLEFMDDDVFNFGKVLNILSTSIESSCLSTDEKYIICGDIKQWETHWKKYKSIVPSENRNMLSFRNCISLGKTQDIATDKGVTLLTAHMSKGLQFEVVFVVGLCEGTFPDYRAVKSGNKDMEQEKNNMFVAATRAKRLCYFSYPNSKKMPWGDTKYQQPSRFLNRVEIEDYT
jgi:DNA helicase-2/ATP-dependent DNA helicase PcrA